MMRKRSLSFARMAMVATVVLISGVAAWSSAQEIDPDVYDQLKYRFIGPQGNRVIAVAGIPGDPTTYYAGAASGGVFKSTDGGIHWDPMFDGEPVSSIGSLAIAPSDPNIVWAGTGETFIRGNISQGMGIYKSTDAGKNWELMGLEKTGRIGRVLIHPTNPDIVYAAAMGHCYGPQEERGVFRSLDGGETWERVLFVDENTGCSDMVMDPNNPRILFAGMWPMEIAPWLERRSGGPGGGIHVSRDGGTTWKKITGHGLPEPPIGKVALTMSAKNSNRIYALIESKDGVLWRSDDGGENWKLVNRDHTLTQRPAYYSRCLATPDDENEIYFQAMRLSVSHNGGETFKVLNGDESPGGDDHDMWIDPLNPDRMMIGNDGGVRITVNRGKNWHRPRLPIAQMYHVYTDNRIPYYVYGNRQDGPSTSGPSNSLTGEGIPSCIWRSVGGSESGFAVPDPVDSNIVWSGHYEGMLDRHNQATGHSRRVSVWPDSSIGEHAALLKYRFQWTFPIAISPHDHNRVYVGSQHVHRTTNGGQDWTTISPDLTTNDKEKQQPFGGVTRDDESTFSCTVFALAESPLQEGLIWAGTNDGRVQVTRDGGDSWTNVTANIPDFPEMGIVSNVEPSRYDAGTCYIAVDYHNANIRDPHAYKTSDYGETWNFIAADVPKSELSYTHCIREDPKRRGMLYLGTENAVYVSLDDGSKWHPLQNNLPHAPVHWLTIQEHFNDLVIGTYGRGFWILDDLTPLQALNADLLESETHLFAPRSAYRFHEVSEPMGCPDDQCAGDDPPYGASINYYLKSVDEEENQEEDEVETEEGQEDDEKVEIVILNAAGETVRTLEEEKKAGINRVWWDLKDEPTKKVKLRTSPLGSPHVKVGPEGWRELAGSGSPMNILQPPGTYTVKMVVDGQELTQTLTVTKDPNSEGSEADVQTQVALLREVKDTQANLVELINQIEWIRAQIYNRNDLLEDNEDAEEVIKLGKELDEKLIEVEEPLFQMRLTGGTARQDILRWPCKLYRKVSSLGSQIAFADHPPTTQQYAVHEDFKNRVDSQRAAFEGLVVGELAPLNDMLKAKNFPTIYLARNP